MITCKYCGQELKFIGEVEQEHYFDCSFCEMTFPLSETSAGRKRKMSVPEYIDTLSHYATTEEILECNTITLYYTLKDIRAFWYYLKTMLEKSKVVLADNQLPKANEGEAGMDQVIQDLLKEFRTISKKKFVIENVILERTGFLPEKITEEFLSDIYDQGKTASQKPMYVYIK